jgi:hypothetical protein
VRKEKEMNILEALKEKDGTEFLADGDSFVLKGGSLCHSSNGMHVLLIPSYLLKEDFQKIEQKITITESEFEKIYFEVCREYKDWSDACGVFKEKLGFK